MPHLELTHVNKRYHNTTALHDVSLSVQAGEFLCLLGPSGCGKTTTLRIIAGFEAADGGDVWLEGENVTNVPPQQRDIGVVFQSYALFPHLTVNENVGFGLKMRRRPSEEIEASVSDALRLVQLDGVGDRLPRQLSGGQQQRVALARAIAIRPRLLLLDEPLSNLDAKLRDELRDEIRRVQRATGITTVFVTHDQVEALALADRMAIMDQGRIVQVDTPRNVYEQPADSFVAAFIGQANLIQGAVTAVQGSLIRFVTASGMQIVGEGSGLAIQAQVIGVIKNERIRITRERPLDAVNTIPVRVESPIYLGATILYHCTAGGEKITAFELNSAEASKFEPGSMAFASWRPTDCLVLRDGGAR
ncbi:MAG: ABC transporter ATP-binding protein [Candidatus Acidiferrales bacterium]